MRRAQLIVVTSPIDWRNGTRSAGLAYSSMTSAMSDAAAALTTDSVLDSNRSSLDYGQHNVDDDDDQAAVVAVSRLMVRRRQPAPRRQTGMYSRTNCDLPRLPRFKRSTAETAVDHVIMLPRQSTQLYLYTGVNEAFACQFPQKNDLYSDHLIPVHFDITKNSIKKQYAFDCSYRFS